MNFLSRSMRSLSSLSLAFLILCVPGFVSAASLGASYVVDQANVIENSARQMLSGQLQELEQKTGVQMIVLTIDSTDGIPIEQYALGRAENWQLGQKGKDNGLLMVVAVKDKRYRIETGYGLESILPDSLAGSIAREHLVPRFRQGDYTGGIMAAAAVIMNVIAQSEGVELAGVPKLNSAQPRSHSSPVGGLLSFLILIFIFSSLFRRGGSRGLLGMLLLGSLMGGRRSSGFGSFGGGGFGSFGGGGGGGFGGGGVSGGW